MRSNVEIPLHNIEQLLWYFSNLLRSNGILFHIGINIGSNHLVHIAYMHLVSIYALQLYTGFMIYTLEMPMTAMAYTETFHVEEHNPDIGTHK